MTERPGLLVLCEPADGSALWAAAGLRRRTSGPVDVVTGAMLGSALGWEHRLRGDDAEVDITLADGRHITSEARPVLNRLLSVPTERLAAVAGPDLEYARQEMQALFLSWLHALPGPMLNRPSPQFLGGHWRHPSQWAVLAAGAGLAAAPFRQSADDPPELAMLPPAPRRADTGWLPAAPPPVTVFVVAGRVVPPRPLPGDLGEGCRQLAKLAGDELLGIDLQLGPSGTWELVTASSVPDLRSGGEPLLDALADALDLS